MRGRDNSNYIKSRNLCESLCNILGLSRHVTHSFTRIISEALVHIVAGQALDNIDGKLKNIEIEIPFIGKLSIDIDKSEILNTSIELEDKFRDQIIKAVNEGESPLIIDAEKSLIESIKKKYNSLV